MKNKQKGSSLTPLIVFVALVILGIVYYIFFFDKSTQIEKQTYSDLNISFEYPTELFLKNNEGTISIVHSIAYMHADPCDFKGDAKPLSDFTDFYVSMNVVGKGVQQYIEDALWPDWDYVSRNPYKQGDLVGYHITPGVEGCGEDIYYLQISKNKTLIIKRPFITEFNSISADYKTYLALPGIIDPAKGDLYFNSILSSLKFK